MPRSRSRFKDSTPHVTTEVPVGGGGGGGGDVTDVAEPHEAEEPSPPPPPIKVHDQKEEEEEEVRVADVADDVVVVAAAPRPPDDMNSAEKDVVPSETRVCGRVQWRWVLVCLFLVSFWSCDYFYGTIPMEHQRAHTVDEWSAMLLRARDVKRDLAQQPSIVDMASPKQYARDANAIVAWWRSDMNLTRLASESATDAAVDDTAVEEEERDALAHVRGLVVFLGDAWYGVRAFEAHLRWMHANMSRDIMPVVVRAHTVADVAREMRAVWDLFPRTPVCIVGVESGAMVAMHLRVSHYAGWHGGVQQSERARRAHIIGINAPITGSLAHRRACWLARQFNAATSATAASDLAPDRRVGATYKPISDVACDVYGGNTAWPITHTSTYNLATRAAAEPDTTWRFIASDGRNRIPFEYERMFGFARNHTRAQPWALARNAEAANLWECENVF
jgi:hypothetical protein